VAPRRSPSELGVFSFESGLLAPARVVLDSSFVVHALLPNEPLHEPCLRFLMQMAEADTEVFFNRLLELEIAEVGMRLALIERHGKKNWKRARLDGRSRRRATRLMQDMLSGWASHLAAFDHGRVELHEVVNPAMDLMALGLSSYDAVHAATATFVEADGIVTTDTGFGALPERSLRIYTSSSKVAGARARRRGTGER
jgi:predicted nucleic acid-binding protein